MRTIGLIIKKEFLQIFRDKVMLPILFVMPIMQLLILSFAVTYEIKNINIGFIDTDNSQTTTRLIDKFEASPFFNVKYIGANTEAAQRLIDLRDLDLVMHFEPKFETALHANQKASVYFEINAINGSKAGVAFNYANSILQDYNHEIRSNWLHMPEEKMPNQYDIKERTWFNPDLNYQTFMVPGILVILVTMIGAVLSGMNIVKEKEAGTVEQINVTPIKKSQFIIGKLIPFWIIGLIELTIGLTVGVLLFDIPILGNLGLLFSFAALYLTVVLGMGLFVSTFTATQQQAMFVSFFALVIFILMSGLFTPIESMPNWAQTITHFNPVKYFIEVIRMLLLKGSQFGDLKGQFLAITVFSIVMNSLAVLNYRKTT